MPIPGMVKAPCLKLAKTTRVQRIGIRHQLCRNDYLARSPDAFYRICKPSVCQVKPFESPHPLRGDGSDRGYWNPPASRPRRNCNHPGRAWLALAVEAGRARRRHDTALPRGSWCRTAMAGGTRWHGRAACLRVRHQRTRRQPAVVLSEPEWTVFFKPIHFCDTAKQDPQKSFVVLRIARTAVHLDPFAAWSSSQTPPSPRGATRPSSGRAISDEPAAPSRTTAGCGAVRMLPFVSTG